MRLVIVTFVLGSVAAVPATLLGPADLAPATSYLQYFHLPKYLQQLAKFDSMWLPNTTEDGEPARYVTAPVKSEEIVKSVMATGTLVPALNVEVGSVLSGQVSKLRVDFNDRVKKDQVLAELDDRTYALAVDASRAALEGARFEVKSQEARLKHATLDLWQTEHQLPVFTARADAARIALETAEREFKRKQWLQERDAAATADVQNTQARRDSALSALREAEANLANQTGLISAANADVERARADFAATQATVLKLEALWQSASIDLERTKIRSPVDGVIVGRSITEGQTLATGLEAKTLFTIAGDLGNMEINARIDESDIAGIKDGQDATFTVDAFAGRQFSAKVKQIRMAPQVLSNVVTYTVVLKTPNPDGMLLPGMTVLANIVTNRTPGAMTVPTAALRYRPRTVVASRDTEVPPSDSIWVLRNGKAIPISVVKAAEDGKNVTVSSDRLRPGDLVIVGDKDAARPRHAASVY
jgi:HlyD family secretion protein